MNKFFIILLLSLGFFISSSFVSASIFSGTIDSAYKYAWGDKCGWINFATSNSNVTIVDDRLTGYIWNEVYGWINLAPATSGVKNNSQGTLSGYAWGENTGWINFSGVTINSEGQFTGTASGDVTGTINFNCSGCTIKTDWRPVSVRTGGPASVPTSPSTYPPSQGLLVLINNGQTATNNLAVILSLQAGSDVKKMAISNSPDFAGSVLEDFQATKNWTLTQGDGQKTIYVKFYNEQSQPSVPILASVNLDTQKPEVVINRIKLKYNPDEDVIIGGSTKPNSEIRLRVNGIFGMFFADNQGKWLITLGKKPLGEYIAEFTAKDSLGNMGSAATVKFTVENGVTIEPPGIIEQIGEGIKKIIPPIFGPEEEIPEPVLSVPIKAPVSLNGKWEMLSVGPINVFVLSPLPKEIIALAKKFPKLGQVFESLGIKKLTDLNKLQSTKLTLPGLNEIASVSVEKLTKTEKEKIPSEILFAKTGGGLVDVNIVLSVDQSGNGQQKIKTTSGQPLKLVLRADEPVKKITGYFIFKQKNEKSVSFEFPLNFSTAALALADPLFAKPQKKPVNIEDKLVLSNFEFEDSGGGVYTADVNSPIVSGEYEIIVVIDYVDSDLGLRGIRLINVVDPEGYIYKNDGKNETRINKATVSLYWLNPETNKYELWPAKDYLQENPQTTDVSGSYSFLVPEGSYYLSTTALGYIDYKGEPFQVTGGTGVHFNIELKIKYWLLEIIDWKIILLTAILAITLLIEFYKYTIRAKNIKNAQLK